MAGRSINPSGSSVNGAVVFEPDGWVFLVLDFAGALVVRGIALAIAFDRAVDDFLFELPLAAGGADVVRKPRRLSSSVLTSGSLSARTASNAGSRELKGITASFVTALSPTGKIER